MDLAMDEEGARFDDVTAKEKDPRPKEKT